MDCCKKILPLIRKIRNEGMYGKKLLTLLLQTLLHTAFIKVASIIYR